MAFLDQFTDALSQKKGRSGQNATDLERELREQFLDLLRLDAGELKLRIERIDLGTIIETACQKWQSVAAQRGIKLTRVSPPAPVWIEGDSLHLGKIFDQLLHNALHYTPPGGQVRLRLLAHEDAEVMVRDSGPGIPVQEHPNVFQRFFRGDHAATSVGHGLGLALVREIVNLHHGMVALDSEEGFGTTFHVRLPRRQPRRAAVTVASEAPEAPEALSSTDRSLLDSVTSVIEANLDDEDLSVDILADRMNMDRSQLYRRLRSILGEAPSQLIRRLRLERARGLLYEGGESISDIAFSVGFKSVSHFSQSFRDTYRLPPSKYRQWLIRATTSAAHPRGPSIRGLN